MDRRHAGRRGGARPRAWALAVLSLAAWAGLATLKPAETHAQRALLLPAGGDPALAAREGERARQSVQAVLEEIGFQIVSPQGGCAEPSCAPEALRARALDMAVGVALWPRGDEVRVALVLVDPDGHEVSGLAVSEGDVAAAARHAFDIALADWSVRRGALVRVLGRPEGATITVDRELWGSIPHQAPLAPGEHRFVVSAAGHRTERRSVALVASGEPTVLRFELEPERGASGDPALIGLGAGVPLAALGITGVAVGIASLAPGTTCASASCGPEVPPAERVIERPDVGASAAWLVGGGVVWAAGVGLVVWALSQGGEPAPVEASRDGLRVRF
jgi:hypothetical protein